MRPGFYSPSLLCDLIAVKLATGQNESKPCYCTPKCERTIYRSTVTQAGVSKAMLRAVSLDYCASQLSESANRLEDYVIMHTINTSWATTLYRLSTVYRVSREKVLDSVTKVDILRDEIHRGNFKQPTKLCILTFLDSITDATSQFVVWEISTYYLNTSSLQNAENFITHMANDIVRDLRKLEDFVSGFRSHLQLMRTAAEKSSGCNETSLNPFLGELHDLIKQANGSISTYEYEYKLFSQIVQGNQRMMAYQFPTEDSPDECIRWATTRMQDDTASYLYHCRVR